MCRNIKPLKISYDPIVNAKFIKESPVAWLLNCDGDHLWFPKSICSFNAEKEELELPKWLYKSKWPNEPI